MLTDQAARVELFLALKDAARVIAQYQNYSDSMRISGRGFHAELYPGDNRDYAESARRVIARVEGIEMDPTITEEDAAGSHDDGDLTSLSEEN